MNDVNDSTMRKYTSFFAMLLLFVSCINTEKNDNKANEIKPDTNSSKVVVTSDSLKSIASPVKKMPTVEEVMGKINPANDPDFIQIDTQYTDKSFIFLQREAYSQFLRMHEAATQDGVELFIISATRPFDYQKGIWERKWRRLKNQGMTDQKDMVREILRFSAMPGTSRHHWGTDIDLNYLNNAAFESGYGQKIYDWLVANAASYGYHQPYTAKGEKRPHGYEEEKWHWSYLPIANNYFRVAKENLRDTMITGFSGAEFAADLNVVEHYVFGVDPSCQ